MKKFLFFIFVFFAININVSAASRCSYSEQAELLNKAANVKANYEVGEEVVHFSDMDANIDYFNIVIYNITDEFYVIVKNDFNNDSKTFSYDDTNNGVVTYRWDNIDAITNFKIEVYTSTKTNCSNEKFKTIPLQTPRYNEYYDREVCEELTDFYLCKKYISSNTVSEDRFFKQLDSYKSGKINEQGEEILNKSFLDRAFDFIKDNKWYILGGLVIITGGIVFVYTRKNKKRRELGL